MTLAYGSNEIRIAYPQVLQCYGLELVLQYRT